MTDEQFLDLRNRVISLERSRDSTAEALTGIMRNIDGIIGICKGLQGNIDAITKAVKALISCP